MKNKRIINCSGGIDLNSKHPLVYLFIQLKKDVICPYCSKKFTINNNKNKSYIEASDKFKDLKL